MLNELELRVLLAVDATRADRWKIMDELRRGGLPKSEIDRAARLLDPLRTRHRFVERLDSDTYQLTDRGRAAARDAVSRLDQLVGYASRTLR
ncbi:hypothetical protein O7635_36315 [Asanoa sp. WMMD1127]|uniref:hypothetical protein n=1 Tax=Asanoa sp. WMMD1127 TaxID=3016107 RepID=UPI002417B765|nr:hypothetical protein [Asanoa sp. WMMD1127]MDG4827340.1 hypothetical protein [Asanoa sp. WMMD1127]